MNTNQTNSFSYKQPKDNLNLTNNSALINNSSVYASGKTSTETFLRKEDQFNSTAKENFLDEEDDCFSKFEQTMYLDKSPQKKTWRRKEFELQQSNFISDQSYYKIQNELESSFEEKAIQLINITSEGDFEVNESAMRFLQSVEGPIVSLGVAGMYRTGKSYLLNKVILRTDKGFGVAPTINACTKGIWIYSKAFNIKLVDGRNANLIVMDSEGLGALDQDSGHDCRIFALILLLSSSFLFNSTGAIDENSISNLSLVINLTKHIKVKGNRQSLDEDEEDEEDPEELSKFFPSFLWILRDFSLELVNELGSEISPNEYLENALALHKGISEEVERKNRLRRLIKQFFTERQCFPLVRPLMDEGNHFSFHFK
jgi:hypothetical protein